VLAALLVATRQLSRPKFDGRLAGDPLDRLVIAPFDRALTLARITSGEPLVRVDAVRPDVPKRLADVIADLVNPDLTLRADDAAAIASRLRA